jgi:phenylpropionate dioxygenase-like ring-hydroxylating dioxygenase large terminal subunit
MNSPARALPAWAYSHPEMTRLEYERILKPSWQIVCHVNSIPAPGDFVTLDLGTDSVVAIRNSLGQIQAFHNVCRHRGSRILDGRGNSQAGSCPGSITCPYHGWSYRLSGELIGVPVRDSFPGLDRSQHGLKPVRTVLQFGFVFVSLAGDPPPLESLWGSFLEDFAAHRFEALQPLGPLYIEHWEVDWSRITCRSDIRGCSGCSHRTMRIRPTCRVLRAESAGCVSGHPRGGASGCISSSSGR